MGGISTFWTRFFPKRQWRSIISVSYTHLDVYKRQDNTKVLSVTSINGFIMAFTRQLKENGIQNFEFYDEKFKNFEINFTKEAFIYSSSQYRKFSNQIIEEAFGLDIELV